MKHMALACCCSRPLDVDSIHTLILEQIKPLQIEDPVDSITLLPVPLTWVLLNGNILGAVPLKRNRQLYQNVRQHIKIAIQANQMLSVSLQRKGRILQVQTDEGRCCRPLVVLEHINQWLTTPQFGLRSFDEMLNRGWIEWLDVAETMMHAVATNWTFLVDLVPSVRPEYKYMELHPSMIAGFSSAIIPYANMNPGPRVSYAASMAASGIGMYATNMHQERDDSLFDSLDYPQRSLTPTTWATEAFLEELPTFQNAVVAILCYGGNNQEDAVIVSQNAIDFGMFRSTRYRSFRDTSSCQSSATKDYLARQQNRFGAPDELMRPPSVDADGLAKPGFRVQEGDVLMHKVVIKEKVRLVDDPDQKVEAKEEVKEVVKEERVEETIVDHSVVKEERTKAKRKTRAPKTVAEPAAPEDVMFQPLMAEEMSHPNVRPPKGKKIAELLETMTVLDAGANAANAVKFHDPAVVDRVMVTEHENGDTICKVRLRSSRVPAIGDKLASQGPQKGVIGEIRAQVDMPFTQDSIVPDVLLVTHSIPSRMTLAQLTSMMAGVVACMSGQLVDSTSFKENQDVAKGLAESLLKHGLTPHGSTVMYDGITGEALEGEVFMGVTTYQRMRQQTVDKYHVRGRGQVQLLTRQPTEGKATSGGLRLGEMERGAPKFSHPIAHIIPSGFSPLICAISVMFADCHINAGLSHFLAEKFNKDSDGDCMHLCPKCRTLTKYTCPEHPDAVLDTVHIPQAFALLVSELRAMNVAARLTVAPR